MAAPDSEDLRPDELVIEVDGNGVHLATLDAPAVLNLAVSYLTLLTRCAEDRDETLEFHGLRAFEKCGALGTNPSDPTLARRAVIYSSKYLSAQEKPPRGIRSAVDGVRDARNALPSHYRARVRLGSLIRAIDAEPVMASDQQPAATVSLRAYVQRVGGAVPRAIFTSNSESKAFSLELKDPEQAHELGGHLYRTVDIVALVMRDDEGNIEGGRLREFCPIAGDTRTEWAKWFKESGVSSWEELRENQDGRRNDG